MEVVLQRKVLDVVHEPRCINQLTINGGEK
jgi:hypothetical protein